ncbi:MAG: hypothetical protein COX65_00685 [Elusimicrobia bacterium CG_4_10_14_0_2_um_filter_56_8]|nr:MAG: hypothetical protein AUJ51_04420 [Elusimicrobia bacterium CG1_02_56_21]PJA17613.1 MAG: hypothetical protein COX65_00685 [Elusimicrobia bacterium CG_4_10_14_0_2_um_filter_56_8]
MSSGFVLKRLAPVFLALGACASARLDVIQVGPWFAPRDWREVRVFSSRGETPFPWGGIAIIHSERVSAEGGESRLERLKIQARKRAAKIGADGLILTVDSAPGGPQMGVYQEPELYLSALAIKYVTAVSTSSSK